MDGKELKQHCADNHRPYSAGVCDGYILSVADITRILDEGSDTSFSGICVPKSVTVADVRRNFLLWAEEHANELQYAADTQLIRALRASYPCPVDE